MSDVIRTPANNPAGDQYSVFMSRLHRMGTLMRGNVGELYTTDASGLYDLYLSHMSEPMRQHHNCNSCRRFVERYGHIVTIGENGRQSSVLWDFDAPDAYHASVFAMNRAVKAAKVTGLFVSEDGVWGEPVTGEWTHMAVRNLNPYVKTGGLDAYQYAASKRHEHGLLAQALIDYPHQVVTEALRMVNAGLYRDAMVKPRLEWFKKLHDTLFDKDAARRHNLIWWAAANAPAGWCHIKNNVENAVLDGIKAGKSFEQIKATFEDRVAPDVYQRAVAAPTAGAILEAERVIAGLKAEGSLARRYARWSELPVEGLQWVEPRQSVAPKAPGGVFADITPKAPTPIPAPVPLPAQTMTWEKFKRTVLTGARRIEAFVPSTSPRFAALTTAVDPAAPNLQQWPNTFSWYYSTGGVDAEFRRRVEGAGGRYEGVDIRASLLWHNRNDLDLHCLTPAREQIFFGNKQDRTGGALDVDMNIGGETTKPVENIRWPKGFAKPGAYRFWVENYRFWEPSMAGTSFSVELEVNGSIYRYDGVTPHGCTHTNSRVVVFELRFEHNRHVIVNQPVGTQHVEATPTTNWNVSVGTYVNVKGIVTSPNLWTKSADDHHGRHTFFVLEGCRDTDQANARGLFTEHLKSELRPVHRTLEAYFNANKPSGVDSADACGLGYVNGRPWDLKLRVTSASGVAEYVIDRED